MQEKLLSNPIAMFVLTACLAAAGVIGIAMGFRLTYQLVTWIGA